MLEATLRLGFLATIHSEASERVIEESMQGDAQAFCESEPLNLETFDRFWTLQPIGDGRGDFSIDQLSTGSAKAVTPDSDGDLLLQTPGGPWSLREVWTGMFDGRSEKEDIALTALRWLVSTLLQRYPLTRSVNANGPTLHIPPREVVDSALRQDGWDPVPGETTLNVDLDRLDVSIDGEGLTCSAHCTFYFRTRPVAPPRTSRVRHRGEVDLELRKRRGKSWEVGGATLIYQQLETLLSPSTST